MARAQGYGLGYLAAFGGLAFVLVVGSAVMPQGATGGAAGGAVALRPEQVVAVLQTAGRYPDALRSAMAAQRATPGDRGLAESAAQALIAEGRAQGDSRLVGAAVGLLRPFLAEPTAGTLYLAATARQYQHDFPGALALLDRALTLDPANLNARLSRATIHTVRGDYGAARADCDLLTRGGRADVGFLCRATTEILTANGPGYADRLRQILATPDLLEAGLRGWALGLVGEIALYHGDRKAGRSALAEVLAADPLALRERLMLADLALQDGQAKAARDLLAPAPDVDGVLIRRVLAARALSEAAEAERLAAALAARVQRNLDLGLGAHAREEGLYFLRVAGDPARALARAEENWALQHEVEDAELLIEAAEAAGMPEAAQPVRDWMAQNGVIARKE